LRVSAKVENGRIAGLATGLLIFNREEALGGGWKLTSRVPEVYLRRTADKDVPTFLRSFNITSSTVVGTGYEAVTTPRSSANDLNARGMNYACLLPFHRCRTPLNLMPNVAPLLEKQKLALYH